MPDDILAAQKELNGQVLGTPGVTGTAIGERGGKPCLKVYLSDPEAGKSVPKSVGGFPVDAEVTGSFRRL